MAVAAAAYVPTAPTPIPGTRPRSRTLGPAARNGVPGEKPTPSVKAIGRSYGKPRGVPPNGSAFDLCIRSAAWPSDRPDRARRNWRACAPVLRRDRQQEAWRVRRSAGARASRGEAARSPRASEVLSPFPQGHPRMSATLSPKQSSTNPMALASRVPIGRHPSVSAIAVADRPVAARCRSSIPSHKARPCLCSAD